MDAFRCVDMLPVSARAPPARMSMSVVFPDPFAPINAMRSPADTLKVRSPNRVLSE